jgi:hypothetical protein
MIFVTRCNFSSGKLCQIRQASQRTSLHSYKRGVYGFLSAFCSVVEGVLLSWLSVGFLVDLFGDG